MSAKSTSVSGLYQTLMVGFKSVQQGSQSLVASPKGGNRYQQVLLDALNTVEDVLNNNMPLFWPVISTMHYRFLFSAPSQQQQGTSTKTSQNQSAASDLAALLNNAKHLPPRRLM